MNPRLPLRYLGWTLRDAAVRPGLACVAIAALFAFISSRIPASVTNGSATTLLTRSVGQFDWLIVLIATAGLVSADRASGHYRSLFSQPVNPGLYYLQRWLVCGIAVAAFVPLMSLGILAAFGVFPFSGPLLARLMLKYLLLGGLTFALSTVLRVDWLIAFLLSILQGVLHQMDKAGLELGAFTRMLARALPPFQAGSVELGPLSYPSGGELTHALLYGAGLVALALVVLALRPLGSGGRA